MQKIKTGLDIRLPLIMSLVMLVSLHISANNDSLHQVFMSHMDRALEFQEKMERDRLDSIMDIALPMAEELGREKNIAYSFYLKADGLSQKAPEEAISYADLALEFYKMDGDNKMLSVISLIKGNCQSTIGDRREAIETYKKAIDYSLNSDGHDSPKEQHKRLVMKYSIGMTYNKIGDLLGASEYLHEVLLIAEKTKNNTVQAVTLQQLGSIDLQRRKYDEAITFFREGLEKSKKYLPRGISPNLAGLSQVYRALQNQDSAIYYAESALEINLKHQNIRSATVNLLDLSESYFALKDYKKSLAFNNQLLDMAEKGKMPDAMRRAQVGIARCQLKMGNILLANSYSKLAMQDVEDVSGYDVLADVYSCAADCESALGNFEAALKHQKKHQQFADSVLNKTSKEQLDVISAEFENERKEEKIRQLELQQKIDKLNSNRRMLWLLLASAALIIALLSFYLIGRRKKFELEKQKENIEQRLLRSQLNPHFIFNAISSIQNYLFDASDHKTALKYLAHFSELMRQILENSRSPYISLQAEVDALKNYLQLQLLRYNQKFDFRINIEKAIDPHELMVPPLIIQPFVENAIEHGKIYMLDDGAVTIDIKVVQQDLIVTIADNGKGFDQLNTKLDVTKKSKSLGTQITKERLDYLSKLFNRKFKFSYAQNVGRGTEVKLILPKVL